MVRLQPRVQNHQPEDKKCDQVPFLLQWRETNVLMVLLEYNRDLSNTCKTRAILINLGDSTT